MSRHRDLAILALILATSCGAGAAAEAPQPPDVMRDTFTGCTWGMVESATLSVWSYACDAQHGNTRLLADNTLPGFRFPGGRIAIVAFTKPATAPVEAIVNKVRAASPGPNSDTCTLAPIPGDHGGRQIYAFAPTGDAKRRWDASQTNADQSGGAQPPCGFMGPGQVGDRYFEALPGDPRTVVFIEAGSELQIFDADTLRRR
jgi:hypothetical protein